MSEIQDNSSKRSKKSKSKSKPRPNPSEDGSSNELVIVDELANSAKLKTPTTNTTNSNNKKRKKRDSASSDEERWLTAIESGKLEDVDDELKKIKPKDPALMTARQRAMYDRGADGQTTANTPTLMSLPTGYKEKVMTAEAIQKAQIKSLKRKQLADEKREKDKKKTMERLLKKQDSKAAKAAKSKIARMTVPVIVYKQTLEMTCINLPDGIPYPIQSQTAPEIPKPIPCAICSINIKKYCDSKTGTALCSLECYKQLNIT